MAGVLVIIPEADIAAMQEAHDAFNRAKTKIALWEAKLASQRAAITLLLNITAIRDGHLTGPLGAVEAMLFDEGRRPSFAHDLEPPTAGRVDKPQLTARESVAGMMAIAVQLLWMAGRTRECAAAWVSDEADKLKLRTEVGALITPKQVLGWRDELKKGRGTRGATETWDRFHITQRYAEVLREPRDASERQAAEALALGILKHIADHQLHSAPKERGTGTATKKKRTLT